jgi:hypothetical protein
VTNTVATIVQIVLGSGCLGALLLYFNERRVNKAKGDVAEGTVDVQIDRDRLGLLEGRLNLLNKTFDAESAAKDATIAHLQADLAAERTENVTLRRELEDVRAQLKQMSDRVDALLRHPQVGGE